MTRDPGQPARGRVLIVDDEALVRRVLKRELGGLHESVLVPGATNACDLLEADTAFDVILCDLQMPEMSGMDLYDWIMKRDAELASRMIFITGGAFTQKAATFLKSIPNHKIEKPFEPGSLRDLVGSIVTSNDRKICSKLI